MIKALAKMFEGTTRLIALSWAKEIFPKFVGVDLVTKHYTELKNMMEEIIKEHEEELDVEAKPKVQ